MLTRMNHHWTWPCRILRQKTCCSMRARPIVTFFHCLAIAVVFDIDLVHTKLLGAIMLKENVSVVQPVK